MNIEMLPSGSYRATQTFKGHRYRVTFDHKPSKKEAMTSLAAIMEKDEGTKDSRSTFSAAAERYVNSVDGVLSPSTIKGYDSLRKYICDNYPEFSRIKIRDMRPSDVQCLINEYASGKDDKCRIDIKTRSPKTVRNMYGFIRSVMKFSAPGFRMDDIALPAKRKKEFYIPVDEDVRAVFDALRGTEYEIPVALASLGMRRSEICGADASDLDGNILYIHRSKVLNKENEWVTKDYMKTETSERRIEIPEYIADLIRKKGYIYKGSPGRISKTLNEIQDRIGVKRFSVHKLRHFYASSAIALNVPIKYIQRAGGWKNDSILQSIYAHAMEDKVKQFDERTVAKISGLLSEKPTKKPTE